MLRKTAFLLFIAASTSILSGCEIVRHNYEYISSITFKDAFSWNSTKGKTNSVKLSEIDAENTFPPIDDIKMPEVKPSGSIVVCRSHQCAPAKLSMSREYIYNSILQLFDNNNYQKVLVCQADPNTHTCLENYITIPLTVGVVPTNAYIDHLKITDISMGTQNSSFKTILNYNLTYGGQVADCSPAKSLVFVRNADHVLLEDGGYNCKITTIGNTSTKTVFAIDYIDLDYGYIGGKYSVGFSGPAYGGGSGYMLLRFSKNAYPLSPALKGVGYKQTKQNNTRAQSSTPQTAEEQNYQPTGVQIFPIKK